MLLPVGVPVLLFEHNVRPHVMVLYVSTGNSVRLASMRNEALDVNQGMPLVPGAYLTLYFVNGPLYAISDVGQGDIRILIWPQEDLHEGLLSEIHTQLARNSGVHTT